MKHARDYYRTNHGENKEAGCINDALAVMQEQGYGREPAGIFRPRDLKKVRDAMAGHFMSVRPLLVQALATAKNPFLETVPSYAVNKPAVHHTIINEGGGGTVWKQIDAIYEPGRRVKHWLKRKRSIEVEAFVPASSQEPREEEMNIASGPWCSASLRREG